MGFFGKKKSDIIDFSDHKSVQNVNLSKSETDREGFVDFSSSNSGSTSSSGSNSVSSSMSSGSDDFLNSLASSSGNTESVVSNLRNARASRFDSSEVNELKIKLEDSEYKMRQLEERVRQLESKLGESGF